MRLLYLCFVIGLCLVSVHSSVIQTKPERKLADEEFLKKQKLVLNLFLGLGHNENFHNDYTEFDFNGKADHFVKPEVVQDFLHAYHDGFLPVDAIHTAFCHHTRKDTRKLFDLFYFAKDFDTFYNVASWARKHVNPIQFAYAYTAALLHREDCQYFQLPPIYEILPNYFVPTDTLHHVYDARMLGVKSRRFTYNNTGYEYNYHEFMFNGPFSPDTVDHLDYKISYFREDVGANMWYAASQLRFPGWMRPEDYRGTHWYKRGESLYYKYQQIFARYILERLANGLPYVEKLKWMKPIRVGYDPRVSHFNGEKFFVRPDNFVVNDYNKHAVIKAKVLEKRLFDIIDTGTIWEVGNSTVIPIKNDEGIDRLGRIVFGLVDRPNKKFFGKYFWEALEALGFAVHTSSNHKYQGGAVSNPTTTLRDPAFYQFLNRLLRYFDYFKRSLPRYTHEQVNFPGVKVKDFDVDKLVTYFDHFHYEVTNAVPFEKPEHIKDYHYEAIQYRLNHKPYNYKLTVNSEQPAEGLVRVYIGPKYDSEDHELNLEQARWAFVEIDRFPVKLVAGENVIERNSKESPLYSSDPEGLRSLYQRVDNALKNSEQFYYSERHGCGVPERLQLPRGWKSGLPFRIAVVVTHQESVYNGDEKQFYSACGGTKLHDGKPFGFPFDRPIDHTHVLQVPNIFFKDVLVYHKDESDVNRSQ